MFFSGTPICCTVGVVGRTSKSRENPLSVTILPRESGVTTIYPACPRTSAVRRG